MCKARSEIRKESFKELRKTYKIDLQRDCESFHPMDGRGSEVHTKERFGHFGLARVAMPRRGLACMEEQVPGADAPACALEAQQAFTL